VLALTDPRYLLSGYVEKLRGVPDADFGLVDVYGLALAARLLIPRGDLAVSNYDLKLSNQRFFTDDGQQPLPIYTAVRHEIPDSVGNVEALAKEARFTTKHYDWFNWFEWTPYEFYSEELNAGIPTWAVGRKWQGGKCVWRENGFALPELRIPLMMGIWGSAFCATLSHYYKEIRPILKSSGLGGLDTLLAGKSEDLVKVHPIDPAVIPNFALGLKDRLPASCPESMYHSTHLQLMDAGMANNLPIYPLLRRDRKVDVIVAFDASADVRGDNWIKVVDGYARQHGIKGWPMGAGWPPKTNSEAQTIEQLDAAQATAVDEIKDAVAGSKYLPPPEKDLSYCTVWSGTIEERHEYMDEPVHHRIETADDERSHLLSPHAGITLIYFPFLANQKVPGVDPLTADFMSTWNFVYTPEQIDKVVALARANFEEGKEQTRRTIRAVWERKKMAREKREREELEKFRRWRVKREMAAARRNGDFGQGDLFGGS
jgi:cytosolic phospholipase A2